MNVTQAERITALEIQVSYLVAEQQETNKKLEELLTLRNKGAGIFWLASVLFGTSIIGVISYLIPWVRS